MGLGDMDEQGAKFMVIAKYVQVKDPQYVRQTDVMGE
jgi:hypothetical protein